MEVKNMKLGFKLLVSIVVLSIIGIGTLVVITQYLAQKEILALVNDDGVNIAEKNSKEIQDWLNSYMEVARTLAGIMEQYETVEIRERRDLFNMLLTASLEKYPELLGAWTIWEPNALDGLDAEYANTAGSDGTGRYIPWWRRSGNSIAIEACVEYDTSDYYQIPLRLGQEMLAGPDIWDIDGTPTLMIDLCLPVKRGGRVIGAIGLDIKITTIQDKIADLKPFGDGLAAVYSNGGIVAAHFDPARIGRPMQDTEKDSAGPYLNDLAAAVRNGSFYNYSVYVPERKSNMYVFSVPLIIGKTGAPWALVIWVSEKTIMAPVRRMLFLSFAIGGILIFIIAGASVFIARSFSKPIN
jgi:methyl-accepting chemotaxis protein